MLDHTMRQVVAHWPESPGIVGKRGLGVLCLMVSVNRVTYSSLIESYHRCVLSISSQRT
jgi:hypothetical protein